MLRCQHRLAGRGAAAGYSLAGFTLHISLNHQADRFQPRDRSLTITTYTEEQVAEALNRACDEINDAAQLSETGTIDALNLLVNAAMTYLKKPEADLGTVAEDYCIDLDDYNEKYPYEESDPNFDAEEKETYENDYVTKLDVVLGWINGG